MAFNWNKLEYNLKNIFRRLNTLEDNSSSSDSGSSELPILNDYPKTDSSKVGQKFIYKGREWKYHSQTELDDLGWTSVSEGYPAPVSKTYDPYFVLDGNPFGFINILEQSNLNNAIRLTIFKGGGSISIDFSGFGKIVSKIPAVEFRRDGAVITEIKGAELLLNLEDTGTGDSFKITSLVTASAEVLDDFFTQLPNTTKTATLDVSTASGSATCDPTIATAKGYTVVT